MKIWSHLNVNMLIYNVRIHPYRDQDKRYKTLDILSVVAISLIILLRYFFMTQAIQGAVPVWLHTL